MTPGTKVRTKVSLYGVDSYVPSGLEGAVVSVTRGVRRPIEVRIGAGHAGRTFFYRSDELEIIE